jgi:hypothetical protein
MGTSLRLLPLCAPLPPAVAVAAVAVTVPHPPTPPPLERQTGTDWTEARNACPGRAESRGVPGARLARRSQSPFSLRAESSSANWYRKQAPPPPPPTTTTRRRRRRIGGRGRGRGRPRRRSRERARGRARENARVLGTRGLGAREERESSEREAANGEPFADPLKGQARAFHPNNPRDTHPRAARAKAARGPVPSVYSCASAGQIRP